MQLPDTSDTEQMAYIGRLTVLRRARNEAAKKLRDKLIPMLNSIEHLGDAWDVSGAAELLEVIQALTAEITNLDKPKIKET
jgi:hypothetical protein